MMSKTYPNESGGLVTQLYGEGEGASLGKRGHLLRSIGESAQGAPQSLVYVDPVDLLVLDIPRRRAGGIAVAALIPAPLWEPRNVKHPPLEDAERAGRVDGQDDAVDGGALELCGDGGDGVGDPDADARVAGLADGEVVGAGGEEGLGGVEAAVVEEGVDGEGEEGGEGGEERGGLRGGDREGLLVLGVVVFWHGWRCDEMCDEMTWVFDDE